MKKTGYHLGFRAALLVLLVTLAASCSGQPQATLDPAGIREIPGLPYDDTAEIERVDAVVDSSGALHVAWAVRLPGTPHTSAVQAWYSRGDSLGARWTTPRAIDSTGLGGSGPKILVVGDTLRVVFGRHLQSVVSADAGMNWKPGPTWSPRSIVDDFDVIHTPRGDVLACVDFVMGPGRSTTLRFGAQRQNHIVDLGTVQGFKRSDLDPALLLRDGVIMGMWPLYVYSGSEGGSSLESRRRGRLFFSTSGDSGATWSSPDELAVPSTGLSSYVASADLVRVGSRWIALAAGHIGLHAAERGPSGWEPWVTLDAWRSRQKAAFRSLAAVSVGDKIRMAWIDSRFEKGNRFWYEPFLASPWVGIGFWQNNDVLFLETAWPSDPKTKPLIRRITPPVSHATWVAQAPINGGGSVVVWAGRKRIRHNLTSTEGPRVFYTLVP